MRCHIKFLIILQLFQQNYGRIYKNNRRRYAIFRKAFIKDYFLDIDELKYLTYIETATQCVNYCVETDGCVSVNYHPGERKCYLLPEDRQQHPTMDNFKIHSKMQYYDTVQRDLCNEKNTCYPYKCWSTANYRSPCMPLGYKENNLVSIPQTGVVTRVYIQRPTRRLILSGADGVTLFRLSAMFPVASYSNNGYFCKVNNYGLYSKNIFCVGTNNAFYHLGLAAATELTSGDVPYVAFYPFNGTYWLYINSANELFEAKRTLSCPTYYWGTGNSGYSKINMGTFSREICTETCIRLQILYRPEISGIDWHSTNNLCNCVQHQTSRASSGEYHNCHFTSSVTTTSIPSPKVKAIQYHDGFWYALGVSCDCVMKHPVDSSPDINKWVEVTSGVVTQFKLNFNGDLLALLDDQNLHQWDFEKEKWIIFYTGPFIHFDVGNSVFVIKTDYQPYVEESYVPQPKTHIGFNYYNETGGYTPYGRGKDFLGNDKIYLHDISNRYVDKIPSEISWDQYGKGKVLYKNSDHLKLGATKPNSPTLSMEEMEPVGMTISLWIRLFPQSWTIGEYFNIITNRNHGESGLTLSLYAESTSASYLELLIVQRENYRYYSCKVGQVMTKWYYWTHVAVTGSLDYTVDLLINGTGYTCSGLWHHGQNAALTPGTLKMTGPPAVISDMAFYPVPFTWGQIRNIIKQDFRPEVWNPMFLEVTATTCLELKQQRAYQASGMYWIVIGGERVSAYCDMVTDGGGWTLVMHHNKVVGGAFSRAKNIGNAIFGNFGLNAGGIEDMYSNTAGFTQFRFRCTKTTHSRVVDVATTTPEAMEYYRKVSSIRPEACGSFYALETDSSVLSQSCAEFPDGKLHQASMQYRLTDHPLMVMHQRGFSMREGRSMCDDVTNDGDMSLKIYVR